MAREEMEEPRRRWARVRGAVPCEGSNGAKGLMRLLEGEIGDAGAGTGEVDAAPIRSSRLETLKEEEKRAKGHTIGGESNLGWRTHRPRERGWRRERVVGGEGIVTRLLSLVGMLDVGREAWCAWGGGVEEVRVGVVVAGAAVHHHRHTIVHARRERACTRGRGDEVEVDHVCRGVAHAHGEGVAEGEGKTVAVQVGGEEGVEQGVVYGRWKE